MQLQVDIMNNQWDRMFLFQDNQYIPVSEATWSHWYTLVGEIADLRHRYRRVLHPPGAYYWTLNMKRHYRHEIRMSLRARGIRDPYRRIPNGKNDDDTDELLTWTLNIHDSCILSIGPTYSHHVTLLTIRCLTNSSIFAD